MTVPPMKKRHHSPWLWIPSLCAAEEIPSTMVTFVSLLMFIQFGVSHWLSSLYAALLFLPWVFKSYMRTKVRNAGYFKNHIHGVELGMFVVLFSIAMYVRDYYVNNFILFLLLFLLAFFCAWHELLARMYYNRMLYPRQQKLYDRTRIFASQTTVVLTYGVLIIFVGFLEVFFRSIHRAWAMENYLVAGAFLCFVLMNFAVLQNPRIHNPYRYESLKSAFKNELHIVDRIRQKDNILRVVATFSLLMLPQSLLFIPRVFFLMGDVDDGGLGCSVQDVGFAFGTIGVIAFYLGIGLGRHLLNRTVDNGLLWWYAMPLTLSPGCYYLASLLPQFMSLWVICSMAFVNQFCFGFGLNISMPFVRYVSGERYRNTINYLYIPFVASAMLVPVGLSGWLLDVMGFQLFFLLCVAIAPVALLVFRFSTLKV